VALVEPAPAKEEQEEAYYAAVSTNSSRQLRKTTDSVSRSLKSTEDLLSNELLPKDIRCCWSFRLENWPS
jgi:hypothetical protein